MSSFGARLQALRNRANLTQEEFAKKFTISKSAVGMYERDEREPSLELVAGFAEFFSVTTDYLLTGAGAVTDGVDMSPEQAEFLKWVEENLEESFFYDFDASPEENKAALMETLRAMWEVEKRRAKRDKGE